MPCATVASAFVVPSSVFTLSRRPRPRPSISPTRAFYDDPSSDDSQHTTPSVSTPSNTAATSSNAAAPSRWVQTALLTLFEPVPENQRIPPPPPPPPDAMSKWAAVWEQLVALYSLRLRIGPRRMVPPPPSPPPSPAPPSSSLPPFPESVALDDANDKQLFLVETPSFHLSTGIDPIRALSRVVVFVADLMADAVVLEILSRISKPADVLRALMGVLAAYTTADLVSALYNWLRLNFSPNTALFGEPSETPSSSFSKLLAPFCVAVAPLFAVMLASPPGEIEGDAFVCYFLTFVSLLPAFGEWSSGERRVPLAIQLLQKAGVVVRRSSQASLHRLEYCVVCGVWDSFLKRVALFSALERWIYVHSGRRIRPRVWDIVPEARVRACGPNDELLPDPHTH